VVNLDEKLARLRAHIHTAIVDAECSVKHLAKEIGVHPATKMTEYLNQPGDMPTWVLLRVAEYTRKPLWWFLGEQPQGITVESAEVALQNVSRARLYLDALESEFQHVLARHEKQPEESFEVEPASGRRMAEVVDREPYLSRARAILEREVESQEPVEVSEESVEMVAQGLYSAEIALRPPGRPSLEVVGGGRDNVRHLPIRHES